MNAKSVELVKQKQKPETENVQPATEKAPDAEVEGSPATSEDVQAVQEQEAAVEFELFPISLIPKEQMALASKFGIPIEALIKGFNSWAGSVEKRFGILADGVDKNPQRTIALLQQEVNKEREQYQKQHPQGEQQRGPAGLGGLGELLPLLGPLLGTASPNDQLMQTFMASAMQNTIESQGLGNAFLKAIISRLAPQYADEVAAKMPKLEVKK
jgi:hypothetical protein